MNNGHQQIVQEIFTKPTNLAMERRPLGGVRQDKSAFSSARVASSQPALRRSSRRARHSDSSLARSQKTTSKKRLRPWTIWVKREVKAEGLRIAEREGVSPSAIGAALMEEAVHQKLHVQHAILLQPMIKQAVREQMAAFVPLLVRVAFEAGQTRGLVTNILGRQPGVSAADLKTILEGSGESAKANIRRRTPQMVELTEAVQRWMGGEGEAQPVSHGDRKSQLYQKPGRS